MSVIRERQVFCDIATPEHRARVQLLAAILHLLWPGSKHLNNRELLEVADTELTSFAFTDAQAQTEAEDEAAREVRIAKLMRKVCSLKQ